MSYVHLKILLLGIYQYSNKLGRDLTKLLGCFCCDLKYFAQNWV